ncbi:MAG: hypothetical protein SCM57_13840, partial [Bacillota bacterium]|nr:hypothetical protein [Bacillota bacterium]
CIRFDSKDVVEWADEPCSCGRTFRLFKGGVVGRADDITKVKGVLLAPSAIEEVVRSFCELGGMILCRKEYASAVDKAVFPGLQGGPLMHVVAAKAVAFKEALQPEFGIYARQVVANSKVMASRLTKHGFTLVSGGTDNHLVLVDLRNKGLTGKLAEETLDDVGITLNKNTVPFDTESPFVTSGLRIGTPSVTSRGMQEEQMEEIADCIADTLHNIGDETVKQRVRARVGKLCASFSIYE